MNSDFKEFKKSAIVLPGLWSAVASIHQMGYEEKMGLNLKHPMHLLAHQENVKAKLLWLLPADQSWCPC